METQSHYQVEYPEKPVLPIAYRSLDIPAKESQYNFNILSSFPSLIIIYF